MLIIVISFGVFIIGLLIPGGSILMAGSVAVIIHKSERTRSLIKHYRGKYTWWNEMLHWLEDKFGRHNKFVKKTLSNTRPDD